MFNEIFSEFLTRITKDTYKSKNKLKVSKYDDRMMEDGTLNVNHHTLTDPYMSDREFNERQRSSKYH